MTNKDNNLEAINTVNDLFANAIEDSNAIEDLNLQEDDARGLKGGECKGAACNGGNGGLLWGRGGHGGSGGDGWSNGGAGGAGGAGGNGASLSTARR